MWKNIAILFPLFCDAALSTTPGRKWIRTASGFAPVSGFTLKVSSRGAVDCSRICSQLSATRSYFYYETSGECECHDNTYTATDAGVIASPTVRYYEEEGGTLSCPADVTSSTNVIISGSSRFRIRAFLDTDQNFYDSETRCASVGGTLYRAVTLEKYLIAYQLFTECTDFSALGRFWVNGLYNNANRRFETQDGEPVLTGADVWQPNTLDGGSGSGCVWMWSSFSYKFDDVPCTSYVYAICEIPA